MERTVSLRDELTAGVVAGVAGGILIDLFLFALQVAGGTPPDKLAGNFAFIAAVLLGPSAYGNPAAVPLGIAAHFCVAIGWALGYVYLSRSKRQLLERPWISGAGFGIVVCIIMQIVLLAGGQYQGTTPRDLDKQLLAHIFFYGIPVALVVSSFYRLRTGFKGSGHAG